MKKILQIAATAGYFIGLAAIGAIANHLSPDVTMGQVFQLWALYDVPRLTPAASARASAVSPRASMAARRCLVLND